jgi:hypothetical protein
LIPAYLKRQVLKKQATYHKGDKTVSSEEYWNCPTGKVGGFFLKCV